ncbi:hypothetical protein NIES3974_20090 [Calothrix sp. NIES-3974]|nr:hypothetical protein NIES3974_20090 [Calothrix sp. NIES-3974]
MQMLLLDPYLDQTPQTYKQWGVVVYPINCPINFDE